MSRDSAPPTDFCVQVGARLRAVRNAKGLSLEEVEWKSDGRWGASSIGAYERAFRTISVPKLAELADFYDVPLTVLLGTQVPPAGPSERRLCFDLDALTRAPAPKLRAFVRSVAQVRGDYSGRPVTLRDSDVPGVAALVGADTRDAMFEQLDALGVLATEVDR